MGRTITPLPLDPFADGMLPVSWLPQPELQHAAKVATKKKAKAADEGDDDDLEDDDDLDDDDEGDDDDDPDDEDDDEEDPKELARKLKVANAKLARDRKRRRRDKEAEEEPKKSGKGKKKDDDDEIDEDEIRDRAQKEADEKADERVKKIGVRAGLKSAGLSAASITLLTPQIDLRDLDVDEDGEIDGLDEAIDELRDEYPELFKKTRTSGGSSAVNGDDDRGEKRPRGKQYTATEIQAAKLEGRRLPGLR